MMGTTLRNAGVAIFGVFVLLIQQYGLRMPSPAVGDALSLPEDYHVQTSVLEGVYAKNERLKAATRLFDGKIQGAESASVDPDGALVLASREGGIWRAPRGPDGSFQLEAQPFAKVSGGRPLGIHHDKDGNLIICTAGKGLDQVRRGASRVAPLTTRTSKAGQVPASPIPYANDLDIAPDGTIYFTDSSHFGPALHPQLGFFDTLRACVLTMAQGARTGRLLSYSPETDRTSFVAGGFLFPNGVAVSPDGGYLIMAETGANRLWKIWLQGAKAGQQELFLESLPGHPDGVARSRDGRSFWVALVTPPSILVKMAPYRFARWLLAWLPPAISARVVPKYGCVLQVSLEGQVLQMLMDTKGEHVATISSVLDLGDQLILGSLGGSYLAAVSPK